MSEIGPKNLEAVFQPKSVAVIGASRKRGTVGAEIFHNLLAHHFQGVIYPVNPNAGFVQAVKAYSKITDIPDPVDLAVLVVPKKLVLPAVQDCVTKGVKAIVIISAGFRETGEEGKKLEDQVAQICRESGIRLVGPNCLGVLNTDPAVQLDATFAPTFPPEGNVAFSSQSGALGLTILDYAKELGIGISKFISIGNRADVSGNDLIEFWGKDDRTDVILLYLESFGDAKRFLRIAREVTQKKPIVAVKSGRSRSGARAAASHTGALAASDATVGALFGQTGVIRVDTVEELFDMAMLLAHQPLPQGNKVGILTNAGGPGIMAADACENWGLSISEMTDETKERLREILPPEASVRNPIDMIASAPVAAFRKVIPILLHESNIDSLLVIYVPPIVTNPSEIAEAIVEGSTGAKKPILTCFLGTHGVHEGLRSLKRNHIPSYSFPEAAVAALARSYDYHEWLKTPAGSIVAFSDMNLNRIEELTAKPGWMISNNAFELLEAAKIPVAKPRLAKTSSEAVQIAKEIGFPVALKIVSPKLLHKSDVQGVQLNLRTQSEVENAANEMEARAHKKGVPREQIDGFFVQSMLEGGKEVILGVHKDPRMGHVVMFGLGGVQIEVLRDVSFRIYPFSDIEVSKMVREIRGYKVLDRFRGDPARDIKSIEEMLLRLGYLISKFPAIAECDLNPVKVFEEGHGAFVLDARFRIDVSKPNGK